MESESRRWTPGLVKGCVAPAAAASLSTNTKRNVRNWLLCGKVGTAPRWGFRAGVVCVYVWVVFFSWTPPGPWISPGLNFSRS